MILDYSDTRPDSKSDPMEFRVDAWASQMCNTLNAASTSFREPGHSSPPNIRTLVSRKGFEVNAPRRVAIWHSGFTAAAERLDAIVPWLDGSTNDHVLAGL